MRYQFEDFVLCQERRELHRGSDPIGLGPQVFDLLVHLVQNREHVVTRDNLIDVVWGGRIVSESTITTHINAARKAISDSGEDQRLIRTIARKGYRFVGPVSEVDAVDTASRANEATGDHLLPTPDRPSIAVLPFVNLSGDPAQDYFVDGIVDDVICALSRKKLLFVIARNSSFTYKGRSVDVKQVGRELGVRYVLEGSLRASGNRVRITGQLADTSSGTTLWSERFDSTLTDIFELQDQITTNVVGAIVPSLERAEIERSRQKPTDSLDAYDYYLRGLWTFRKECKNSLDDAQSLFCEAYQRDPEFAAAYAMAASCYSWRKISGWSSNLERETADGIDLAYRAIELGQNDAIALAVSAHALAHLAHDFDTGTALLDRALTLDPNLAFAWYLGGYIRIWRGHPAEAIDALARAMRLNPLSSDMHRMEVGTAMAHLLAGQIDEAISWADKATVHLPSRALPTLILAAIYAHAGHVPKAKSLLPRLYRLESEVRLSELATWLPFQRPQDLGIFAEALCELGLPN